MKTVQLTQGRVAIVDDADFEMVSRYKWRVSVPKSKGGLRYALGSRPYNDLRMHRLIISPPAGMQVDHINGDGLDNRRENLRVCTGAQNMMNRRPVAGSTSRFKGVSRFRDKWKANVTINGCKLYIGVYESETLAAQAVDWLARKFGCEFTYLNFPEDVPAPTMTRALTHAFNAYQRRQP